MRLTDNTTLNFNNNMSTVSVFLDIDNVFDAKWHLSYLYKLSKRKFSISLIKLISLFLSQKRNQSLGGRRNTCSRDVQAGVPQGSVLSTTLYSIYINDTPQIPSVCLGLSTDDTYIYATAKLCMFLESRTEVSVLLRRGVTAAK
jgi:hypothetical protein